MPAAYRCRFDCFTGATVCVTLPAFSFAGRGFAGRGFADFGVAAVLAISSDWSMRPANFPMAMRLRLNAPGTNPSGSIN